MQTFCSGIQKLMEGKEIKRHAKNVEVAQVTLIFSKEKTPKVEFPAVAWRSSATKFSGLVKWN
jgi:hypothetical protein